MTRIGIYRGCFSPPHKGHVVSACAFMEQMELDFLYVLPSVGAEEVSAEHRLNMARLAFFGIEGVYVSDMEIGRGDKGGVLDTLRSLSGEDKRLFLLCGTDTMLSLEDTAGVDELFRLCYPTYVRREKDPLLDALIVKKIALYREKYGKVVRRIVTDPIELSSQSLRERLGNGAPLTGLVSPLVEKYIRDNHLYV